MKATFVDQVLTDRIDTIMTEVANNSPDQQSKQDTGNWIIKATNSLDGSGDPTLNDQRCSKHELVAAEKVSYSIHSQAIAIFICRNQHGNDKAKGDH
ncbi:hypothetical protein O9993_16635 [Vibrio lentus]|nr:hypothetical protein [Vibrio lentus]